MNLHLFAFITGLFISILVVDCQRYGYRRGRWARRSEPMGRREPIGVDDNEDQDDEEIYDSVYYDYGYQRPLLYPRHRSLRGRRSDPVVTNRQSNGRLCREVVYQGDYRYTRWAECIQRPKRPNRALPRNGWAKGRGYY